MKALRTTSPIRLSRPVHIPPIPQRLPRHVSLPPVRIVEQVLFREARIEPPFQLQQAHVVVEEHERRGKDEEAAVEVVGVLRWWPAVVVAPEVAVGGEHICPRECGFVVADHGWVSEGGLGESGLVVEDAVEVGGDEVVGVDEEDLAVLCHGEEAELDKDIVPALDCGFDPAFFQLVDELDGGAIFFQTSAFARRDVFGAEDDERDAAVRAGASGVKELVCQDSGA